MTGVFRFFCFFDVCEAIDLEAVRRRFGIAEPVPENREVVPRPPAQAQFERAPVTEPLPDVTLRNGDCLRVVAGYYDYGVIGFTFEHPFRLEWPELVEHSVRMRDTAEVEAAAGQLAREAAAKISDAMVRPRDNWLTEEYYVVQVHAGDQTAAELIRSRGSEIARLVRGEAVELSPDETEDVLRSRISYYPNDLLVAGWSGAFVYDTAEGAAAVVQLLQHANTQLLEFRYYDHLLSQVLSEVYRTLGRTTILARWRLDRSARRLNRVRIEVREISEKADNSIKFLSDMYAARVYRLAAEKVGAHDYRRMVDSKLQTAAELYDSMVEEFRQGRAFLLELIVVIILVIDLVFLFRGEK